MSKYNKKTILNYVKGNDIEDYDIETLEDDYEFMIEVINYTNDKNIYNLCSDKVKNNYEFVKFIVNKFKNDLAFICSVAHNYLENTQEETNKLELIIIMYTLTENKDDKYFKEYNILSEASYLKHILDIALIKQQYKDDEVVINEIQLGFWFIINKFHSNETILNFYAKKFIEDILKDVGLEDMLHQNHSSYEEIECNGINNYLINYLNQYDTYLSLYISTHLNVLDEIKDLMSTIKLNWNKYDLTKERKIYNKLLEEVHFYMEEYGDRCSFEETEILYFIGLELGISKKILKYDYISEDSYEELINNMLIDKSSMSQTDLNHYHNIKQIMLNILNLDDTGIIQGNNEEKQNNVEHRKRILRKIFSEKNEEE